MIACYTINCRRHRRHGYRSPIRNKKKRNEKPPKYMCSVYLYSPPSSAYSPSSVQLTGQTRTGLSDPIGRLVHGERKDWIVSAVPFRAISVLVATSECLVINLYFTCAIRHLIAPGGPTEKGPTMRSILCSL